MKSTAAWLLRSILRHFVLHAVTGATWAHAQPAAAEPSVSRSLVILVRPPAASAELAEAPTRIVAELEAAGFEVEVVDGDPSLEPLQQLEQIAARTDGPEPVATIVLADAASGMAADIWIADRLTSKTSVRRIDITARSQGASILAVRTVELLRASLLETQAPQPSQTEAPLPAPAPSPDPPAKAVTEPSDREPTTTRGALDLGASGLFGFDHIGPLVGPLLRGSFGTPTIAGRLALSAPVFGPSVEQALGSARVQPFFVELEAVLGTESGSTRWYGSAGLGAYLTRVQGTATAPAIAHDAQQFGALLDLGLGAQFALASNVGLFIEPHALWLLPAVAVDIADREAGRIGHPALSVLLGVSWSL